jgi:dTDP-glucose pyrophosphorylase
MRISAREVVAEIVRPDISVTYLNQFKSEGYRQVVFIANVVSDPDCVNLDGNVYSIDELLKLDNPLFRISHPNCECKFEPLESGELNEY